MEPEMKLERQVRKGIKAVAAEFTEAMTYGSERPRYHLDRAQYISDLVCQMVKDYVAGRPQPWSYYEPRIEEEFGE